MRRREFLQKTGLITAGTLFVPSFLRANTLGSSLSLGKKRLVVIQLSGGNDGLNTIVPHGLDEYYQNRSQIGHKLEALLKLDDRFGWNKKLPGMKALYDKGLVSIINSVGYPNPNRSHFRSMDIWHTASNSDENWQSGWLGRYLDKNCTHAFESIEWDGSLSLAMKGKERAGIALTNPRAFYDTVHSDYFKQLQAPEAADSELQFMYKVFEDTKNSAAYIYDQYRLKTNDSDYGSGNLGKKLKEVATLIKSDIQTPVFYTSLGGFDTHVNQQWAHDRLMEELDAGVSAFVKDLEKDGLLKETTIMIFSEFGRRLKENASRGTDHGAANVLFLIDTDLSQKAHSYNQIDLSDLDKGDPKYKVDFRQVYQEVLQHSLGVDPEMVLKRKFDELGLF